MSVRILLATVVHLIVASAASAQLGGYRLYTQGGNINTSPGILFEKIAPEHAFEAVLGDAESLIPMLAKNVRKAEAVVRRQLPPDATNARRETLAEEKSKEMREVVRSFVGKPVSVTMIVIDVIRLEEPAPPRGLEAQSEEKVREYDEAMQIYKRSKLLIAGKLNWSSATVETDSDRQAFADYKKDYDERIRSLSNSLKDASPSRRAEIEKRRRTAEEGYKKYLERRKAGQEAKKPIQMVYVLGGDSKFMDWKRGQTRNLKGVIQRAGLATYGERDRATDRFGPQGERQTRIERELAVQEDLSKVYVGIELSVWAMPEIQPVQLQ